MATKAVRAKKLKVAIRGPGKTAIKLTVNGETHELLIEPRRTLLNALRKDLGLTGTKKACDEGTCGTCTVLLEGKPIYACMALAIECDGKSVETIESLSKDGQLHPIQRAFIAEDALQCGFCTPGQIMSVKALLDENPNPTLDDVKRVLSGNLCRCGAYPKLFQAALRAADLVRTGR
ncbi:(2Fe-2S)-binding protein [Candidatus Acetothermia bacterium]|jgi:aerobic-type carbon monoxide dehydrogenase small subunit (CoxS/CutS family)|nr:(2Fe-2S)-binding protein [Candidatus Acetothermia bacterium]MCI2431367.1 (2Fe-2S)-binding protein [Candidatus Acetothermia bacterium]MCI2437451.1 (2Fe-2S)-binding protein [Candidatus Acetothermia bacterium]